MPRPRTKRDIEVLEERGLWQASAFLHRLVKRLIRKGLPLEVRHLKEAHKIIFLKAKQPAIAGRYRRDNPELRRIDGSPLHLAHWRDVSRLMMELDMKLRAATAALRLPKTEEDYATIVGIAARLSHRLALIHPFENGNGRLSRLLANAVLRRAGLPEIALKVDKRRYLRAMRRADDGDFVPLKDLIVSGLLQSRQRVYEMLRQKQASRRRKSQSKRRRR